MGFLNGGCNNGKTKKQQFEQGMQWGLPAGSRVWIYLRHSPGDAQTIDSQKYGMQEWAAERGWVVDNVWIDEGIEGSKEEREQFQAMMSQAKQQPRPVDGIAVWSFSRFARDQLDSQFYKADLRKRGYVVTSKIDDVPNNELAPVFEAVIDWKNQRFLDDLSADVKRGQLYLVERGYLPGSHPPPGYTTQSEAIGHRRSGSIRSASRVIKDPELTERVALAWRMKLYENASYAAIHEAVHLFPNRHDYYYFFNNLLYAGIYVFSGKRYPADWQQGARFCEPYVTIEEYYQVQENRRQRTIHTIAPRSLSSNYLLTSILYCAHCATMGLPSAMAGAQQTGHGQTYYRCLSRQTGRSKDCTTPYTPCYKIDDLVINSLKQIVLTPEYVGGEIEKANARFSSRMSDIHTQLRQAEQQVKESERNVEVLLKLIQKKGLTDLHRAPIR